MAEPAGRVSKILENALYQIVMLSSAIPANVCQHHAVIVQCVFRILLVIFSHTKSFLSNTFTVFIKNLYYPFNILSSIF